MNSETFSTTDPAINYLMDLIFKLQVEVAMLKRQVEKVPSLVVDVQNAQLTADAALSSVQSLSTGTRVNGHVKDGVFMEDLERGEELLKMLPSQGNDSNSKIPFITPRQQYYESLADRFLEEEKK